MSVPRYATTPVVPTPEYVVCIQCGDPFGHPDDQLCWSCLHTLLLLQEAARWWSDQSAWEASLPPRYDTAVEMASEMEGDDA